MIHFSDRQWDNVQSNYDRWWRGELGRPILPMVLWGVDPGRAMPKNPLLAFSNCTDLSITPEQIVDRYDYELSCYEYHGDSFPIMQMMQFGPGVAAAFLGAKMEAANNTVWFHMEKPTEIESLRLSYDPDNQWLRRVKDIYRAGMRKWGGSVVMAMTDLGGTLDVLASLLTSEGLLYALYDSPEEVLRLVNELSALWMRFYDEITDIIKDQRGFTDWSGIYSPKPSYMLQCDFCYMISTDMFKTFVAPELSKTASKLHRPFYHLDGIGQLRHLDTLLATDEINGIQWVPGEGDPRKQDWSEVYRRISKAGKKIQAYYDFDSYLDEILAVIERPDDLVKMQFGYPIAEKDAALCRLAKYGAV